jgi:hypothetical protein
MLAQPAWIKDRNRTLPVLGDPIAATAVQASSSETGSPAVNLINGRGLRDVNFDGLNEHSSNPAHMWRSVKGDAKGWVVFDLGKPHTLSAISVWNYNETWHTERGVRKMDIAVWTQAAGWRKIREGLLLDSAEGSDGYDEPTVLKLDSLTAQKVRFDGLVSLGDPEYVGLSKVQFFGPAGPKIVKLSPDDGAEGVGVNDLELTWAAGQGTKGYNVYLGAGPGDPQDRAQCLRNPKMELVHSLRPFVQSSDSGSDGRVVPEGLRRPHRRPGVLSRQVLVYRLVGKLCWGRDSGRGHAL